MQRPLQVTLAATLTFLWAAYALVYGALYATGIIQIPALEKMVPPGIDPATLRILSGAMSMLAAALWAPISFGLLRLKRWARTVTLILCGISLPLNVIYAVILWTSFEVWFLVSELAILVSIALVLWLLVQPEAREAFGVSAAALPTTPEIKIRPVGVKCLVVLCVLAAIGSVALGVVYVVALPRMDPKMAANPEMLRMMRVGMVAGVLPWVAGYALCAFGLWKLRNWARVLAIVFAALWLLPAALFGGIILVVLAKAPNAFGAVLTLIVVLLMGGIPAWTLWYLFRARTKQLFTAPLTSSAPAPPASP